MNELRSAPAHKPKAGPTRNRLCCGFSPPATRIFPRRPRGDVADYIPELGKADPDHFGISLATLDGHVYEVGDSRIPFTIQSMSNRSCSRWRWIRSAQRGWKA